MGLVIPAVLPYSKKEFEEELALFSQISSVNRVQIDVVDGKFALPPTWPYNVSPEAAKGSQTELEMMMQDGAMLPNLDRIEYEIDLMCFDPEQVAHSWIESGATRILFHAESVSDVSKLLSSARKKFGANGFSSMISFGLALNIESKLALIEQCLGEIDFVQFMGIAQIGKQGQPFDTRVLEKVRIFRERHPKIPLQIDGGISFDTAKKLVALGVSNLVIGSGILRATDPLEAFAVFENLESPYGV